MLGESGSKATPIRSQRPGSGIDADRGERRIAEVRMEVGDLVGDVGPEDVVLIPRACPQRITNTQDEDLIFLAICTPRFESEVYEEVLSPLDPPKGTVPTSD